MNPLHQKHILLPGIIILLITVFLQSCATTEQMPAKSEQPLQTDSDLAFMMDTSSVFSKSITGFMLHDPEEDSTLFATLEKKILNTSFEYQTLHVLCRHENAA